MHYHFSHEIDLLKCRMLMTKWSKMRIGETVV